MSFFLINIHKIIDIHCEREVSIRVISLGWDESHKNNIYQRKMSLAAKYSIAMIRIWICETYIECSYIYIEYPKTRKTRNDFLVQIRKFLLPLSLKVLRHKERDTHSIYSGFSIYPPSRAAPVARKFVWPLRAPKVDPSRSVSNLNSTNWLFQISQNPPCASGAWRHSHSLAQFPSRVSIVTSLSDTSYPRVRANTCVKVRPK